ncbi:MAG: hypothetical protein WCO09_04900, partial [bacterium]
VYLWDKQLDTRIVAMNNNLNQARNSFDQNTIKEFAHLNDKINAADFLLKQHVAPSVLFGVIGDTTLKNVRFTNFKYSNAGGDKISIAMSGEAVSYEAVALQSSAFTNPKLRNVFRNTIFSDPDLNANGKATFSFTTGVDPTLLNYYKSRSDPNYQATKKAAAQAVVPVTSPAKTSSNSAPATAVDQNPPVDQSGSDQTQSASDGAPVDNTQPVDLNAQ